jgi:predicted MFS family arabinose efflux permease
MTQRTLIKNKWVLLFLLAVGAGQIFQLPYLRYSYYDAMLNTFGYTNTQLGTLMSMFGVGAVLCYLLGGALADRIPSKLLLSSGQILTGLAGFLFASYPPYPIAIAISIFWAFTGCLIYWPTLMGYIRGMGSEKEQGRLYGLMEGLRGITATAISLGIVALFDHAVSEADGLRSVIIAYAILNIILGIITYIVVPYEPKAKVSTDGEKISFAKNLIKAIKLPQVWLATLIIFCTCLCYDCLGYTTPYLTGCMGASATFAAVIAVFRTWGLQFVGGTSGGFIADKLGSCTKTIIGGFIVIALGFFAMIVIPTNASLAIPAAIFILIFGTGIFINRGVYFATMSESNVPMELTGTVSGFASAVGFLPDAFIYTVIGALLDKYQGALGYRLVFAMAAVSGIAGLILAIILFRMCKRMHSQ